MTRDARRENEWDDVDLLPVLCGGAVLAAALALPPAAVVLVASGHLPHVGVVKLAIGTLRIVADSRWSDPARAYPARVGDEMPSGAWWWTIAGATIVAFASVLAVVVRKWEPSIARERIGRRSGDPRGARPRPWARPRDLASSGSGGFTIGRLDGRMVTTNEEDHVALIAPTRAGKTTRCVIPWLLEHRGPAIVTSTKRDVLDATLATRRTQGTVWVFDPFKEHSARWTPLSECATWSGALRTARWLADASAHGDSEIAAYWRGEAAKLLAPLLQAAALSGLSITRVVRWLNDADTQQPTRLLAAKHQMEAVSQLKAVASLDDRNRGTTFMSAGSVLDAYRFPEVSATAEVDLSVKTFVTGQAHTLYIVASERHQQLLAPLIVAMLSSLLHAAIETGAYMDGARLRVLLDEAANIAPMREMPRLLSQAAGHGIRVATVWQSLAQLEHRYGLDGETVLANSASKLFMGPVTDRVTRRYMTELLDDSDGERETVSASALQQLGRDRALLIRGADLPAVVTLQPFYR